ncbi:MAG: cysteine desulfurase family protein [Rhizobiaceae bacterium]
MTPRRAYLDYNASAPMLPQVVEALSSVFAQPGNASSVHGEGRHYRKLIEAARAQVAQLVNADSDSVIFTGSATEAANLALTPNIYSDGKSRPASKLYVLGTEHPCVLTGGRFAAHDIVHVPVHKNGVVDLEALQALLAASGDQVPYLAIQLVNSETGVIQPVAEAAKMVRLRGGYVLCDAVQAVGRIKVDVKELGVDFVMLSAHKIGGPQGVGALVSAHSVLSIPPAIKGGGQESNRRAGTENTAGIVGFGVAAEFAAEVAAQFAATGDGKFLQTIALRDSIEEQLLPICADNGLGDRLVIFGSDAERVGNTCLFSINGLNAETALIAFDLDGVAVSSGSACSSGKVGSSHVLQAMGVAPELARGAIRLSLGWNSTQEDVAHFEKSFRRIVARLAEMSDIKVAGAA